LIIVPKKLAPHPKALRSSLREPDLPSWCTQIGPVFQSTRALYSSSLLECYFDPCRCSRGFLNRS
jgi:hypothetical protein